MSLAQKCQTLLQDAELRVTRLQEQFSNGANELREAPAEYSGEMFGEESSDEPTAE